MSAAGAIDRSLLDSLGRMGLLSASETPRIEALTGGVSSDIASVGMGDIAAKGGKPNPNDALNISLEDMNAVMNRNFVGTMLMCRAVVPGMARRQKGAVINFGSLNGHIGVVSEVVYGCAKAAILHYTRCLALEMKPHGVRVNAVAPTYIDTEMNAYVYQDAEMYRHWVGGTPMNRLGKVDEVASVILFLASGAASLMTGSVVLADGGYVCW